MFCKDKCTKKYIPKREWKHVAYSKLDIQSSIGIYLNMHTETHIQAMNGHSHCFCLVGGGNLYSFEFLLTSHYVIIAASDEVGVEI